MPRRWLLATAFVVALVHIGVLFSMIAGRAAILRDGREVVLAVRPVDPRDLLRGDYVILTYNISLIPTQLFAERPASNEQTNQELVFVRLKEGEEGIWEPVAARFGKPPEPAASDGEIDLRGSASTAWFDQAGVLQVAYGIERFYVPEGEGRPIEEDLRERPFRMKIAVSASGEAQIKSFHDGERMLYAEPLY